MAKDKRTIWNDAGTLLEKLYEQKGELYEAAASMIEDFDEEIMLLSSGINQKDAEIKKLKEKIAALKAMLKTIKAKK